MLGTMEGGGLQQPPRVGGRELPEEEDPSPSRTRWFSNVHLHRRQRSTTLKSGNLCVDVERTVTPTRAGRERKWEVDAASQEHPEEVGIEPLEEGLRRTGSQ